MKVTTISQHIIGSHAPKFVNEPAYVLRKCVTHPFKNNLAQAQHLKPSIQTSEAITLSDAAVELKLAKNHAHSEGERTYSIYSLKLLVGRTIPTNG